MTATRPVTRAAAGPEAPRLGTRVRRGLAWQLMGRGGDQLVRLLANLMLARLLAPEDFGLLGMAAAGLALADAMAFVGTDQAVMADRRGRRPRFVATAWALSLIRGLMMSIALLLLAAPLARGFCQPQAAGLFMLIALQPAIAAVAHPGAFIPLRELRFARWTIMRLLAVILGTAATVVLALRLGDARALVLGQLATTGLTAIASLAITPRRVRVRPWIHRRHARGLLRFSAGAIGTPLLIMGVAQLPAVLIGPVLGPAAIGVFAMLRRLCDTGQQLAVQAAGSVLVPAAARLADDPARFAAAWRQAVGTSGLAALGAAGMLAWLGGDVPATLLGPAFRGEAGLFTALAVAGGLSAVLGVMGPFFWGLARPDLDRLVQAARLVVMGVVAIGLMNALGVVGVAAALVASAAAGILATAVLMHRTRGIAITATLRALLPGLALGGGLWVAGALLDLLATPPTAMRLAIATAAAAVAAGFWLAPRLRRRLPSGLRGPAALATGVSS